MKKPKNVLVEYQGGGYDGCMWEWNFFLFDEEGEFYCVYASGYAGIKTEAKALEALQDKEWCERNQATKINLRSKKAVVKFTEETAGSLVKGVFDFLIENEFSYDLFFKCETCKEVCQAYEGATCADEATPPGTHNTCSGGGIHISDRDIHCQDCHDEHTCQNCYDFWEDTSNFVNGFCEFCAVNHCTDCYEEFRAEGEIVEGLCSVCRSHEEELKKKDPKQPTLFEVNNG